MKVILAIFAVLSVIFAQLSASPTIISRSSWGAKNSRWELARFSETPFIVVVHHTATPSCNSRSSCIYRVKAIQNQHQAKWNDIGYNFLIAPSGDVYEGRGWNYKGAHSGSSWWNSRSIGISFIGNFMRSDVTNAAWQSYLDLVAYGKLYNKLTDNTIIRGHKNIKATECPGAVLFNRLQRS